MDNIFESPKQNEKTFSTLQPAIEASYWIRNNDANFLASRKKITDRITQLIAAYYISRPDFPNFDKLPPLKPPPFTTFGHQPFLDYQKLQTILWDAILNIKNVARPWKKTNPIINLSLLLGSLLVYIVTEQLLTRSMEDALLAVASFLVAGMIGKYFYKDNLMKKIDATRAIALETLLHYNYEVEEDIQLNEFIKNSQHFVGNGEIGDKSIPVLTVSSSSHPFPGFGRLQFDNLFLCMPDESELNNISGTEALARNILIHVKSELSISGINNINFGEIFIIHAKTLRMNSLWLDAEKRPLLNINRKMANKLMRLDGETSVREYFVVEILFEEFLTSAYFFFRPFMAGNYAACHIAITTLGPPSTASDELEKKLQRYKNLLLHPDKSKSDDISEMDRGKIDLNNIAQLRQSVYEHETFPSKLNIRSIQECDIDARYKMNQSEKQLYKSNYNKMLANNIFWPGNKITNIFNTREDNSLTFTDNYFGCQESLATVKTVYHLISNSILDAMKENGFYINDYLNNDGNYSINEKKFDSFIIGKKVRFDHAENTDSAGTAR